METISETAVAPLSSEIPASNIDEGIQETITEAPITSVFPASNSSLLAVSNQSSNQPSNTPSKFKRTNSVSFNVVSTRSARHSIDIRNMPSLAHKRASIVDVAKGAVSSLMNSFASSGGGDMSPIPDDEPIFEEPIAPTLSLGQRVALVKNSGAEFGTVGWIGQLFDVDDDWMVGVIFDNMIGDCDGAYKGVRYFYAREYYAMFVPLSALTKTDNYIGRPETGTMLSRMSVSLKPGQLISIQRSSIRLQHCFLNAPHQRVGHDVRAVSNRLHCQCHNCGPCAHLTKQASRMSALGPAFGAHHAPNKKNSLAHAAVEILAHHHHHYHEEEHEEEDYQFGDNAAHACNFVRYSCCQQSGTSGHDFSADCEMVRPELLDNLIHAPKAPHRRSRPRRRLNQHSRHIRHQQMLTTSNEVGQVSTLDSALTIKSSWASTGETSADGASTNVTREENYNGSVSSYSSSNSSSSRSTSADRQQHGGDGQNQYQHYNEHQQILYDSPSYHPGSSAFNTIDTQMSLMDQQRYIYQRDSSAFTRSQQASNIGSDDYYDDYEQDSPSFGSSVRRCFNCLLGRTSAPRRQKKRKMSTKNRNLEYRRKQFTFVPSTLAKPHEDFASHGIILPGSNQVAADAASQQQQLQEDYNSDYSSFSKSSRSSRRNSPAKVASINDQSTVQTQQVVGNELNMNETYANSVVLSNEATFNIDPTTTTNQYSTDQVQAPFNTNTLEQAPTIPENAYSNSNLVDFESNETLGLNIRESNSTEQQLKSSFSNIQTQQGQLDYDDFNYSNSDNNSYKKNCYSCESALTDMGYCGDTWTTNSSNDTLKNIVEQTINEEVSYPGPILYNDCDEPLSPIVSVSASNQSNEQVDVSSPTNSSPVLDQPEQQENRYEANNSNEIDDEGVCYDMNNLTLDSVQDGRSSDNNQ